MQFWFFIFFLSGVLCSATGSMRGLAQERALKIKEILLQDKLSEQELLKQLGSPDIVEKQIKTAYALEDLSRQKRRLEAMTELFDQQRAIWANAKRGVFIQKSHADHKKELDALRKQYQKALDEREPLKATMLDMVENMPEPPLTFANMPKVILAEEATQNYKHARDHQYFLETQEQCMVWQFMALQELAPTIKPEIYNAMYDAWHYQESELPNPIKEVDYDRVMREKELLREREKQDFDMREEMKKGRKHLKKPTQAADSIMEYIGHKDLLNNRLASLQNLMDEEKAIMREQKQVREQRAKAAQAQPALKEMPKTSPLETAKPQGDNSWDIEKRVHRAIEEDKKKKIFARATFWKDEVSDLSWWEAESVDARVETLLAEEETLNKKMRAAQEGMTALSEALLEQEAAWRRDKNIAKWQGFLEQYKKETIALEESVLAHTRHEQEMGVLRIRQALPALPRLEFLSILAPRREFWRQSMPQIYEIKSKKELQRRVEDNKKELLAKKRQLRSPAGSPKQQYTLEQELQGLYDCEAVLMNALLLFEYQ